jgi:hypothetical protein
MGRKKPFLITLAVYLVATVATAFSMNPMYFFACAFSPAPESAVSTPPSTPPSTMADPSPGPRSGRSGH